LQKKIEMELNTLTAISPIDGRYYHQVKVLSEYFSEFAYIRAKLLVEVEYFIALCQLPLPELNKIDSKHFPILRKLYKDFSFSDAEQIKNIEKTSNHDVKAVEYFLKEKFDRLGLAEYKEFIHFGLTSQDVNNTAIPYLIRTFHKNVLENHFNTIILKLSELADTWQNVPMLARTHGQPASPTTLGKEIKVFVERLENQLFLLNQIPFNGKFGGATGNFNAHHIAYPKIDWIKFSNVFLSESLGLKRLQTTTQIEHYDNMAAYFDTLKRINTILLDLNRDMWTYISMNYFKQQVKEGEVGSSAMPHKVNPIDFENSEGNICIANALLEGLSAKLPISRLQRDLSDSTVIRNIGVPLAHSTVAYLSTLKGLNKIIIHHSVINEDLEKNWAVIAEAIQTILRREKYPQPYEALKALTRGKTAIDKETIHHFIDTLEVSDKIKEELKQITPQNYIGIVR
jgi:adenylosuccinate lyase